jgi:syntaxin 17
MFLHSILDFQNFLQVICVSQYQDQHNWELVRKEHVNVSRIIKQLKELLYQMDTLRAQVLDADIKQFDKLTRNARDSIIITIEKYLGKAEI